jgi:hypothetical protein
VPVIVEADAAPSATVQASHPGARARRTGQAGERRGTRPSFALGALRPALGFRLSPGQSRHLIHLGGFEDFPPVLRAHEPIEEEIEPQHRVRGERHHPADVDTIRHVEILVGDL